MKRCRGIVLMDLDGTLIDSRPSVIGAIEEVFSYLHIQVPEPLYELQDVGSLLSEAKQHLPESVSTSAFMSMYDSILIRDPLAGVTVMERALCFIKRAESIDCNLVVLTNKRQDIAEAICQLLFPVGTFAAVIGRKGNEPLKPTARVFKELKYHNFSLDNIIMMVGNSDTDARTAALLHVYYVDINSL